MSISANDLVSRIMEKAMDTAGVQPESSLKRYHVSQTADQLPDFRLRNAFYRAELERQITMKKDAERRRKEREAFEEERLLRKVELDREKLRREYLDEIEKRRILQDEAARKQQAYAKKLEEIREEEERKKEEEEKIRQQVIIEKRLADLKEAVEKRRLEEIEKRRLFYEQFYGNRYALPPLGLDDVPMGSLALAKYTDWDYYKRPWNSREYVHGELHPDELILEDVYFEAPLPVLADVYKKLDAERRRIKDIMRQRIAQADEPVDVEP